MSLRWESFQKRLKSRRRNKEILRGVSDGTFIIQESPCYRDKLEMCVKFKGSILYYLVKWVNEEDANDDENLLDSLTQQISTSCFIQSADGVCKKLTALKRAVKRHHPRGRG